MAQVSLRGSVNGVEVKQASQLEFPKTDAANPEINRLWAWHRINALLKDADRKGDRTTVMPEVVRLGEDFSIVTEYTSFLVLENDAEYQRWKIARKNLDSIGRDRQVHAKWREQLDAIRNKALANLGPQAAAPAAEKAPVQMAATPQSLNRPAPVPATPTPPPQQPERRQSSDIHMPGSSPVGPFGVLAALWLARRKRKAS
jgi:hypothetical protein